MITTVDLLAGVGLTVGIANYALEPCRVFHVGGLRFRPFPYLVGIWETFFLVFGVPFLH